MLTETVQQGLPASDRAPSGSLVRLMERLKASGVQAETSPRRLAEYSYDASNYRVPPLAVVFPRNVEDVLTTLSACRAESVPITGRGGGTSMAGNAIGPGVVIDFSRHMDRVLSIDEGASTVDVEPGVVLNVVAEQVEEHTGGKLTFAPDPSSKNRATVGGSLGNDACGNHSVRHGRTSDHVVELDLITSEGARLTATASTLRATDALDDFSAERARDIAAALKGLTHTHLADFRTELGQIQRQVSGYHLSNLLPENGFNVARALVGSEGTCALVVRARMKIVPKAPSALLVCLGYADVVEAARDLETILKFSPAAVEGIDESIVDTMRFRRGTDSVLGLPKGKAWLYVDLDGEDPAAVFAESEKLLAELRENGRLIDGRTVPDPSERSSLWRVREDGAGLSSRLSTGGESWPGWEDSAVAPERLAGYLADFRTLLDQHGLKGVMYGHFGAGCMHIRITYDLRSETGRTTFRNFTRQAAELVVRHGGSLSGEHGDGRARSELLPVMYSPGVLSAFSSFRKIWDPIGVLNPGVLTEPDPIDSNLALAGVPERQWRTSFDLRPVHAHDDALDGKNFDTNPWVHAVQGCIGVGKCRSATSGVMCPSFRATGDEKDSTRGRARVLQDMVRGARSVEEGWKSKEVREVLDLCLSCKACSSDCPAGVDMATYKSEFFSHYYEGKTRPLSHYSLGWLPRWLKITGRMAPIINLLMKSPMGKIAAAMGGITIRRTLPRFAGAAEWRREVNGGLSQTNPNASENLGSAVLFVDTFTRGFRPEVAGAAARVLASAGVNTACSADACCGLTWISTGQLDTAKKLLRKAAEALDDGTDRPIVVIEPSCAAALSKDLPELVHTEKAKRVASRIRSFAAYIRELTADGWQPDPAIALPEKVVLQTHCHEYSVFGASTQRKALNALGITDVVDASGCCGVAGNFGFETQHFEISMKVAQYALAPALQETDPGTTPVLTDGFSCAMQVKHLDSTRPGLHLAQLLDPGPAIRPLIQPGIPRHNHQTKEDDPHDD